MNMEGVLFNTVRDMNFMFLFPAINVSSGFWFHPGFVVKSFGQMTLLVTMYFIEIIKNSFGFFLLISDIS